MGRRAEIGADGLTAWDRRMRAARLRAVKRLEERQALRERIPNPADRFPSAPDRACDIEFNLACRRYEVDNE